MKWPSSCEFDEKQLKILRKGIINTIISIIYFFSVITLMYLVMGMSQAMKTTWIEDNLSLIPPLVFLFGSSICSKKPTKHFPFGFHRIVTIAFFTAAASLFLMGAFLLIDGLIKLLSFEHPSIGLVNIFGHDIWLGWLMIVVLLWGTIPSLILGHMKIKLAKALNDKVLYTDAEMNKDDWLVGTVAIIGVLGIGMGWWWSDATAASLISISILRDGIKQSRDAITELMDRSPKNLEGKYSTLPHKIEHFLKQKSFIENANVRLRDNGHLVQGEGNIVLKNNAHLTPALLDDLTSEVKKLDWRLQDFVLTLHEKN